MGLVEYVRVFFENRLVQRPRTYNAVTNQDGSRTDTPAPGEVIKAGTPLNKVILNRLDKGIYDCAQAVNSLHTTLQELQQTVRSLNTESSNNARAITAIQAVNENQSRDITQLANAHNQLAQDVEEIDNGILTDAGKHMANKNNPHSVTATQLSGVLPVAHGGTGCTTVNQVIQTFKLVPVAGSYKGTGTAKRLINLGFTPVMVLIADHTGMMGDDIRGTCGGILYAKMDANGNITENHAIIDYSNSSQPYNAWNNYSAAMITTNGFYVGNQGTKAHCNTSGWDYRFLAFRVMEDKSV